MKRWLKITLVVLAGLIALLLINAIVVSNETKSAELRTDGAQLIDTANGTLQVLDEGNPKGSPIVLVHCYTCSMRWWDKLAPLLGREHRVIRVDLLGHGGSDKPGGGYAITDQANAVAEALARLGVTGATVVGHSLGGTVITALAEQSPRLASRVVIIDQAPDNSFEHLSFSQELGTWPVVGQALDRLTQVAPDTLVRDQYGQAFAPGFSISAGFENPDQVVDDLRAMTFTSFKDAPDAENDYSGEKPLDERLAALGVPLLVIFGAEDQIYDAEDAIARYRDVPGAETKLIEGAGHSPNVEKADEIAPLILAFAQPPAPVKKPSPKKAAPTGKPTAEKAPTK